MASCRSPGFFQGTSHSIILKPQFAKSLVGSFEFPLLTILMPYSVVSSLLCLTQLMTYKHKLMSLFRQLSHDLSHVGTLLSVPVVADVREVDIHWHWRRSAKASPQT